MSPQMKTWRDDPAAEGELWLGQGAGARLSFSLRTLLGVVASGETLPAAHLLLPTSHPYPGLWTPEPFFFFFFSSVSKVRTGSSIMLNANLTLSLPSLPSAIKTGLS